MSRRRPLSGLSGGPHRRAARQGGEEGPACGGADRLPPVPRGQGSPPPPTGSGPAGGAVGVSQRVDGWGGLAGAVQVPPETLHQDEFLGTQSPVEVVPQLAVALAVEGIAAVGECEAVGPADVGVGPAFRFVEVEEGVVRVKEQVWVFHAVNSLISRKSAQISP